MTVTFVASSQLPTQWGTFTMHGFLEEATGKEHVVLTMGNVSDGQPVLGRLHSECLTGDALFSLRCDCGFQLEAALKAIADEGRGALLYLRQEGRGIGLMNKIRAYHLQDGGADTVEANELLGFGADQRDYGICKPMLDHLGITSLKLLTNNPRKVKAIQGFGVEVAQRLPLQFGKNPHNAKYLATKAGKLGHMLGQLHQAETEPGDV
ncbi:MULTISPECIES: GTP cyclohydrolase II [Pseudomonadaceae]|uniref:GTP cyclohydrolase-2 n=1 Tax=Pseudomonas abyssi TaxID=170540 RepID=A0A395QXH0_9PSED|nr:GTP cyclohydrolase II [Halopseudomonas gallaeciensis]MAB41126.1 GTP cyclohydrolase II [Pseudomonadales bacterium]MAQ49744.1 GTP cyclohydrolase II [Pseudomonas sp.]MEB3733973.1 GTP cyclohydrolase II [Halopseudomonas pachastrellae]MBB51803.1 GTP cyclohydrolase II [Pseudomonadales bacterium]RGP52590.1 GTP cyclohydrolase [Halopseudomonas gallaeciensis]